MQSVLASGNCAVFTGRFASLLLLCSLHQHVQLAWVWGVECGCECGRGSGSGRGFLYEMRALPGAFPDSAETTVLMYQRHYTRYDIIYGVVCTGTGYHGYGRSCQS